MKYTQEERVRVGGRDLALQRFGPREAPPVLCLHGWLDNGNSFVPLAEMLPEHQLLALDLTGHGLSDHLAPGAIYHQVDWVFDVLAVADALGLQRLCLMGHSMGAGIAALTAGTCPERVERLVLIDGTGPRSCTAANVPQRLAVMISDEREARARPVKHRGAPFSVAVRARAGLARPLSRSSAELLCERGVKQVAGGVMFRHDRRLQRQLPALLDEAAVRAFLTRIACPVLLLEAEAGILTDRETLEGRAACVRGLTRVRVPGGHHVHMDDPAVVASHVGPFLNGGLT